eukprot:1147641-Pyramimonas_sp.AAC.1
MRFRGRPASSGRDSELRGLGGALPSTSIGRWAMAMPEMSVVTQLLWGLPRAPLRCAAPHSDMARNAPRSVFA